MKQPVDSFFNTKLKNYSADAPASAWDRIDANLAQKKKPVIWLKIAAGLLLLTVAGFIIYTTIEQPVEQIAKIDTPIQPVETEIKIKKGTQEQPAREEKIEAVKPQTVLPETNVVKHSNPKKEIQKKETIVEDVVELPITHTLVVAENSIDNTIEIKESYTEPEVTNTTILISSTEANAKYLDQQFIADATPETKMSSKLRNLFEKAQDLDPIGEIRQLKNEVLALNFRNEKKGERNR